jgi:hypothetical protein
MRLGSGIAPVRRMREAGVAVGLGVDGSASNDGSQMLAEARQALLLARLSGDPAALSARDALEMATRGGASVLGRDDIGHLAPGMAADFVAFAVDDLRHAGASHDPVAALVFCGAGDVGTAVIDGRVVVREGRLATLDLGPHLETHNRMATPAGVDAARHRRRACRSRARRGSGRRSRTFFPRTHGRQPQHVRRPRLSERNARCDHHVVAHLGEAFLQCRLAREIGHRVDVGGLVRQHRMHAPDERQAARGRDFRRQAQDRGLGPLARSADGR